MPEAKMVMPPIYNFWTDFDFPGQIINKSTWGWHRANELFAACNNIREHRNRRALSAREMALQYPYLYPIQQKPLTVLTIDRRTAFANESGELQALVCEPCEWLEYALQHDLYVPAGLGMNLINATKRPTLSAIRSALS